MINHRVITYKGCQVFITEARTDLNHDVVLSVMGDKFSTTSRKLLDQFHDTQLESQGYNLECSINGGLFFTEGGITYAEGIEQVNGVIHENDDERLNNVMAFYITNGVPFIVSQSYAKTKLNQSQGALTGAFGLLNNGLVDLRGRSERSAIFNAKSGRSIIGKKKDGTLVLASFKGTTGQSGMTGLQTLDLAKYLGLHNALCLDGGGSVAKMSGKEYDIFSTRPIKNAIGLYIKSKTDLKVNDIVSISGLFTIDGLIGTQAHIKELNATIDMKYIKKVE